MDENDLDTAGAVSRYLAGRKPEAQTRASMALAVGTPAEQEAEYRRLAQKAGVPLDTAKGATDEVKRAAALNAVDFGDLAQRFPATNAYLGKVENAQIAHDDVDGMSLTEGLVNSFKRGLPSLKQNLSALGIGARQSSVTRLEGELAARKVGKGDPVWAGVSDQDLQARIAGMRGADTREVGTIVAAQGEKDKLPSDPVVKRVMDAKGFGDAIAAFSTDPAKFIANVGPESLVQSAPGIAAAVPATLAGGPLGGAVAMGGGSFAVDYGATLLEALGKEGVNISDPAALTAASKDQALMRRVMAQAVAHAGVVGAFDAISGGVASKVLLPGKVANKLAAKPLAREIANLGVQVPVQGALGGLGELGGELAAGQEISPGNILAEVVGEAFTAPVEVAAIAHQSIRERMQKAQDAKHDAQVLTDLSKAAEASKVKARDPQSFKAFIDAATENGPVQEVFVSPQSLAQSGVDITALAEASPAVAEQIDAANAGGLDIRIPVSEFATSIAGTPMAEQLIPHLRTDADGMSMVEADEFIKTNGEALRADVEKILARRDTNDAARAGRDAVRDNFLRQIVATGRYTEESAKPVAAAAAAFYATQAGRLGISAEELYRQYPLSITAAGGQAPSFAQSSVAQQAQLAFELAGGSGNMDESTDIYAKSMAFAEMARAQGFEVSEPGSKYFRITKDLGTDKDGYAIEVAFNVRVSDHSNVNRGVHFGDTDINIAPDDGNARDTFESALWKLEHAGVDADGNTTIDGKPKDEFSFYQPGTFDPNDPSILNQQDRGAFTPSTLNITLLETADLSTALHEFGHAFLEISADIAARPDAPADIAADLKTLLDWFGIQAAEGKTQLDTWRDMTLDEQREHHEKFARGFEAYLFEGKAPSLELQGVFQRFRAWLLNVYQTLKSLNVTLTDDVRGVMDRMLASEQEIETAEAAQSMAALFQTPEQAAAFGLDWAKYQELGRAQTEQAISELETRSLKDMQWLSNARSRVLKQLQKDAAEKRRDMRSRVRTEVMAEPVYRAWAFLTGKVAKAMEPTEAEADYRRDLKDYRQKRVEAEEQAGKDERAKLLSTQPDLKGLQKGQFLAKNKRQVDINVQQRMLEWDQANKEPEAPPAADGSVPPGEEVGKLDLAGVKAIDKAAAETLQKRRMTGKDGIDPDVLAEQFGFTSGQQLIKALVLADTPNEAVEGLTDQRMLETYGDISSPEALNRAVNEALFNEARQRAVATELKALEKAMKVRGEGKNADVQRSTVATLPAAAKQFALAMVAKLLVKDIKPNQYAASQARAARAAAKALGADDIATAAKEKRNELVNGYAFRAATDALAEVREIVAFFRRIQKGNRETIAKTRDVNMVMAMRAIVAQYGVGIGPGERATDYLENVKAYDPATYEILRERVEAMSLAAQPYNEISMERLRGLADELKSMWTQSRRARQMEVDGQLVDRELAQADLMAELDGRVPDRIPGEGSAVTPREEFWAGLMSTLSHLVRVESWVSRMDGGDTGPFRKYVWQPIKEAADKYRADKAAHLKRYADLLKTIDIGKARIEAPELGYTFGESRGGSGKQEILHALLHSGNESNKRKLLLGRNWATENEDGTLDTTRWDAFVKRMQDEGILGKAEYDFAQGVWDLLESMKPAAQKAHRDVFGAYFDEVTADAFTVTLPAITRTVNGRSVTTAGQTVTYRGGYVPAMMDRRLDSTAAGRALADDENQTLAYAFPTTSKGFTKSRVEYNRPLLLDLRTLSSHIDKVTLFSNLEAPIRDVRKLLSGDVATAISRMDPAAINEMINPWLQRAASQQVETNRGNETFAKFSAEARKRAGMAALFANLANAAQQVVGVFPASIKTSPKAMASAAVQYLTEPRKTSAMVAAASPYMATRMDNEIAQMNATMSDILLNPNVFQSGKAWLERHAYFVQSAVDNVIGPIVWTAAYNNAIQAGETEIEAARRADSVVRTTQGSTLPEDIARFEGGGTVSGHPFVRLFTQFAGYFNTQANFLGTEFVNTMRSMGLRKGIGRGIYIFTLGFLVPALVSETIVQAFKGGPEDDDRDGQLWDDWLASLGIATFKTSVAMVPVAGQLATATYNMGNDKPYDDRISTSPAISMIESSVRAPFSAYEAAVNGGNAQKAVRDVATLISMTVGVPANAIARPLIYAAGVGQGRIEPTGPADAVRGAVTGVASPESKR